MKKNISLLLFLFIIGCATISERRKPEERTYSEIYPISVEELDTMLSEKILTKHYTQEPSARKFYYKTEWKRGAHPYQTKQDANENSSTRYRLIFELNDLTAPGDFEAGRGYKTLLRISKEIEKTRTFPQSTILLVSDGLEEEALFYRIERLITLKEEGKLE